MQIEYKNKTIQKICTDIKYCDVKYGHEMTVKIRRRITQLEDSNSIESMISSCIGRCHPLHGSRSGQYGLDLVHPYRLIIEKYNGQINIVQVDEIIDYH